LRIRYSTVVNGHPVQKAYVYTPDEHGIDLADVDADAVRIVERLKANGHETYIVGGAVRDLMVGKKPKDFDIVTDATPSRIKKVFRNSRIIGRRFRLVHVFFGPKIFEVSTFRSLKDGPTSNTYGTIEEDVLRRDFSLNALFYDPQEQVVVDYVNGMKDIKARRIQPVIPPAVIFKDDPVRMLRAAKYAAITGFKLPLPLKWRIKKESRLLAPVSPSRLTEEIFKIINSAHAALIVEKMQSLNLYEHIQNQAALLMKTEPQFKKKYLASLAELDAKLRSEGTPVSGRIISYLIKDYLDRVVDWSAEPLESYRAALAACRTFVLPMNPPRVELENAVRLLFREHGVAVKKARTIKGRNMESLPGTGGEAAKKESDGFAADPGAEAGTKKKRRRRRRRPSVVGQERESST
jgi:poly(A) polymerase